MAYGSSWEEKLGAACRECGIAMPVYQVISERRGGRTAWSNRVTVSGTVLQARYWYDGKNLRNAKEDASEVALGWLLSRLGGSSGIGRSGW